MAGEARQRPSAGAALPAALCAATLALLAAPSDGVAARGQGGAISGSTEIEQVKVLRPTRGHERGSLVVWVRASHAPVSAAGARRARAGAVHRGRARVRIVGLGVRRAVAELGRSGPGGRTERGYTVRLRPAAAGGIPLQGRGRRLDVRVRTGQSLDLDGDGTAEDTSADAVRRRVAPEAIARTMSPRPGLYRDEQGALLRTDGSEVNGFLDLAPGTQCGVYTEGSAPIDPQTGEFAYTGRSLPSGATGAVVRGRFESTTAAVAGGTLFRADGSTCTEFDSTAFGFVPNPP